MFRRREFAYNDPPPGPNASILFCFCGLEMHRSYPDEPFDPEEVEAVLVAHMRERHGWRYQIWQLTGWNWVLRGMAP